MLEKRQPDTNVAIQSEKAKGNLMRVARCPTCHRTIKRSNLQNSAYWALIHEISDHIKPNGQQYSAETWHEWCKSKFLGAEDITLPDGRTLVIPHSSSDLDASEFAEYLTKVEAWAAERGCYLEEKR